MENPILPISLFVGCATLAAVGMFTAGWLFGPKRSGAVKEMPYESGMDPVHDARRRFDVRFYLVAIAFLIFDVELLFLYPWAVANRDPKGIDAILADVHSEFNGQLEFSRGLVLAEVMVFLGLLAAGFIYAWRKGVFQWR